MDCKEYNMKESKVTYIFHCGEYEVERGFKVQPTDDELDEAFDDWLYEYGIGCDEIDDMIAEGEAGYYEV